MPISIPIAQSSLFCAQRAYNHEASSLIEEQSVVRIVCSLMMMAVAVLGLVAVLLFEMLLDAVFVAIAVFFRHQCIVAFNQRIDADEKAHKSRNQLELLSGCIACEEAGIFGRLKCLKEE